MREASSMGAEASREPVLRVRGLVAGYGRIQVLHGIDLELNAGQLVALVGANGAGKTTLLRAISGFIPARDGDIQLLGQVVTTMPPDGRVRAGLAQVLEGRHVSLPCRSPTTCV
jgi:branched-chain amino acid transport system ATP-binding protein